MIRAALRPTVVSSLKTGLRLIGETGRRVISEAQAQKGESLLETVEEIEGIKFYCIGDLSLWRVRTLMTKEPETIEWMDTFNEGDVFWDIGANIGLYSIYAAMKKKCRVLAFEPGAANHLLLNRNIEINRQSRNVSAFCVALSNRTEIASLNMETTQFGGSMSNFGCTRSVKPFEQGMIGYAVDDFIKTFDPPFPNHIKIDVDGIESKILEGAEKTLSDSRLTSLQVEFDLAKIGYTIRMSSQIAATGLTFVSARHGPMFDGGAYSDVYNYRFERVNPA